MSNLPQLTDDELLDFALTVWSREPGKLSLREYNRRVVEWHRRRDEARKDEQRRALLSSDARMPFGRYEGRLLSEVPQRYLRRLVGSVPVASEYPEVARYAAALEETGGVE